MCRNSTTADQCNVISNIGNEVPQFVFPKLLTFKKTVCWLLRNIDLNRTEYTRINLICGRPEVANGVVSGQGVKTIGTYLQISNAEICEIIIIYHSYESHASTTVVTLKRNFQGHGAKIFQ